MKVIEKVIKYQDYNYVEGILQFKAYGIKTRELRHGEQFSIERISSVKLTVINKTLAPKVPDSINKNKVSTLSFPEKIITIINNDTNDRFLVNYDEIIIDDGELDEHKNIIGKRFFTNKSGPDISSTIEIKVYGLIKIDKERIEKSYLYEVKKSITGLGEIDIYPKKDYYESGEKIKVKVSQNSKGNFQNWGSSNESKKRELEFIFENKDIDINAEFSSEPSSKEASNYTSNPKYFKNSVNNLVSKAGYSFWDGIANLISIAYVVFLICLLISIFGKALIALVIIGLVIWALLLVPKRFISLKVFSQVFNTLFSVLLLIGLVFLVRGIMDFKSEEPINPEIIEIKKENNTIDYKHHIKWNDYNNKTYETDLIINSDIVEHSSKIKNTLSNVNTVKSYCNMLYKLSNKSKDSYIKIIPKLDSIKKSNNLTDKKFADVIVSMVQSIPYYAIVDKGCNPYEYQDKMLRDLLSENPCEGYQKHGIKTPAEFLKNLKGDCDTRTLFLYGLLKEFRFDVSIFGSERYGHSILGINLNIDKPHFKTHNNKKYYLWEVTGKHFKPGVLPKSISNLNYWSINLN